MSTSLLSSIKPPTALDCAFFNLTLSASLALFPTRAQLVHDALQLSDCGFALPPMPAGSTTAPSSSSSSSALFVATDSSAGGSRADGTATNPFASLDDALRWRRRHKLPHDIVLKAGVHFLTSPIVINSSDSGLSIVGEPGAWLSGGVKIPDTLKWTRANDGRGDAETNTWMAQLPASFDHVPAINTLASHRRLTRARYPNGDIETVQWGYASPTAHAVSLSSHLVDHWWKPPTLEKPTTTYIDLSQANPTGFVKDDSTMAAYNSYGSGRGGLCDQVWDTTVGGAGSYWCGPSAAGGWAEVDAAMAADGERLLPVGMTWNVSAPELQRFERWADATGAVVRVWHPQSWYLNMYNASKHDPARGSLAFEGGGWQGGRVWCRCDQCSYVCPDERKGTPELVSGSWFVENVREEIDQAGEWFFNATTRTLFLWPNGTEAGGPAPAPDETLIVPRLISLVRVEDGAEDVTISNVGFRDAAPSFLDRRWGVPSGGDWALYAGGAVELNGTARVTISQCNFTRVDGNAVYLGGRNRDAVIRDTEFSWVGDSAIALWGESEEWDATKRNYPRMTLVQGNVFRELGIHQKQSSAVFIAKAFGTIIQENLMFNMPRAAINLNDGAMGGHLIQHNVIFNTCRESGDHGAINSWDRMPFLHTEGANASFVPLPIVVKENFITANYGASQGVDNDDGSSFYNIARNVFYAADGFKMDYGGHDSIFAENLVIVEAYDGQNCVNVGSFKDGHRDSFRNNTCVLLDCRSPECVDRVGHIAQCNASKMRLEGNHYYTQHGNASLECGGKVLSIAEVQRRKIELGSTAAKLPSTSTMLKWANAMLARWLPMPAAARAE